MFRAFMLLVIARPTRRLAHKASREGIVAAEHIAFVEKKTITSAGAA